MPSTLAALRASLPQAIKTFRQKTARRLLRLRLDLRGASEEERIQAERRLRGRQHHEKLRRADAVVVSFGKSGRTWLRVMVSRLYQQLYGLPESALIGFDNFHNMDRRVPRIFFTHDNYIGDYTGHTDSKVDFYDKKVVLLVRDPRDVAVSQFFQWQHRMRPEKKALNQYPPHGEQCGVYEFVKHEGAGLPKVIDFMNLWAREMGKVREFCLVRYEDMRADPHRALSRVAQFLEIPADPGQIQEAVDYASYENMKKMESSHSFRLSGGRMVPRDRDNPDSYKVRRAKVGGYRDYFEDDQIREIDALMEGTLDPVYGYRASEPVG
ncbi:MAG TPA: sulfotransferase domain-containing protein [Thiohalobacter sp.]|nr:sulfotransferase domain-containing protein [Thiohalobacter sp.]